ncbi:hypothetical protein V5P93_006990 [Actinokineospora auranticolor]|uniref:Heparin binding hemagglutinin HbhA n=1 Tax=Actinokineospora auranticolor TaxID=155976 RepID=A0A2S6GH75_9PSEU|nr:hypothetical protein [Actinokineospora auranticolor]PPK64555.1 heparin binding hemagglutinin HbhA [Actinokineospora auranticolor]
MTQKTLPTDGDTRRAGDLVHTALEQARTPLLAALGAGDLAAKAVLDAVGKAKARAEATRGDLPTDIGGLRDRFDPAELRRLIDEYTGAAVRLYQQLAEHGEDALGKLRSQPQVKKLEEAIEAAQSRVGDAAGDARTLAEEIFTKVTRKTREAGEKTATAAEDAAAEVAETVLDAGDEVATEIRATTERVADKADKAARKPTVRKAPAKPTSE